MTRVVLLLECGHWRPGGQGQVGGAAHCGPCRGTVRIVGECSPHQLLAGAR